MYYLKVQRLGFGADIYFNEQKRSFRLDKTLSYYLSVGHFRQDTIFWIGENNLLSSLLFTKWGKNVLKKSDI